MPKDWPLSYTDKMLNAPPHILASVGILLALFLYLAYSYRKCRYQSLFSLCKSSPIDGRDALLDILKGITIINIIFTHTVLWSGDRYIKNEALRQAVLLLDVVPFFFISGWLSAKKEFSLLRYGTGLLRLYLPYAIMILFLAVLYWLSDSVIVSPHDVIAWLRLDYWDIKGKYSEWDYVTSSMWFLCVFLFIYILSPAISWVTRRQYIKYIFLATLVALIAFIGFKEPAWEKVLILGRLNPSYIIFFTFFYALGQTFSGTTLGHRGFAILAGLNLLAMLGYMALFNINFDIRTYMFPPRLFYLIASMFSILLVFYLNSFSSWFDTQENMLVTFLRRCGKNSYSIYLYQGFGAMMAHHAVDWLSGHHWTIILAAAFALNLAVSLALAQVFGYINDMIFKKLSISKESTPRRETVGTSQRMR